MKPVSIEEFIELNEQHGVVMCEILTPENGSVITRIDMYRSDRASYEFENGQIAIVLQSERLKRPDFTPRWKF
jgi:hypothetical protein